MSCDSLLPPPLPLLLPVLPPLPSPAACVVAVADGVLATGVFVLVFVAVAGDVLVALGVLRYSMPEVGEGLWPPPQLAAIATMRMMTLTPTDPRAAMKRPRRRSCRRPIAL